MNEEEANRIAAAVQKLADATATLERRHLIDALEAFIKDFRDHHTPDAEAKMDQAYDELVNVLIEVGQ